VGNLVGVKLECLSRAKPRRQEVEMKRIRVQYYAVFREQRGIHDEVVETGAATAADLYTELAGRYRFSLPSKLVRASINLVFKPLNTHIEDEDTVVFIPPVAGG